MTLNTHSSQCSSDRLLGSTLESCIKEVKVRISTQSCAVRLPLIMRTQSDRRLKADVRSLAHFTYIRTRTRHITNWHSCLQPLLWHLLWRHSIPSPEMFPEYGRGNFQSLFWVWNDFLRLAICTNYWRLFITASPPPQPRCLPLQTQTVRVRTTRMVIIFNTYETHENM